MILEAPPLKGSQTNQVASDTRGPQGDLRRENLKSVPSIPRSVTGIMRPDATISAVGVLQAVALCLGSPPLRACQKALNPPQGSQVLLQIDLSGRGPLGSPGGVPLGKIEAGIINQYRFGVYFRSVTL